MKADIIKAKLVKGQAKIFEYNKAHKFKKMLDDAQHNDLYQVGNNWRGQ